MPRPTRRRAAAVAVSLALTAQAAGCGSTGSFGEAAGDAVQLGLGVATLGLAMTGASQPSGGYRPPARSSTYTAPASSGYSQKGAFDDCARLYGSVGATQQEAICRQRSSNMSSLR